MPKVSIIIPCYNDEQKLAQLLAQLQHLPHTPYEVIVVDGAASLACEKICKQYQAHWKPSEPCRGKQLLAGAATAQGDVLWFLHADAHVPTDPITVMRIALEKGALGGYFKFKFDAPRAWPAFILEPAIALRCRYGIPYGDQGLFMTKQAYVEAGGHAPWPLFEEVPLVKNLRKLGHFVALDAPLLVDPRRWQHDGWWHRTWENRKLALAFVRGNAPQKLAVRYRSHITNFNDEKNEA
ncbi:MAG: TIGR04283 family arsenosugar biosynthesis glycosyltransferase [Methylotenera sp.]|nr:TIGR04283 family arsenosugar biosynthesis glycosyltransferase [Methylotenera sp.]MDP1755402.1 TIGR04283 family arsenosugar biosynthesis glycosyltransferase [Methylotenera sp.]MDP1959581.1 TIGR04283 family arsenosugar biosynthesis glycosyltransferase [Methylotenera sp.]MDP3206884.1 TIGR04283 family arsenosugar biosynthesis glycosyltransferase [Methylotenera sp.]MDP3303289.1 TIGR04283 family arsenosugar biosynthesis glycosyltransferase [Methylotenera sp.]